MGRKKDHTKKVKPSPHSSETTTQERQQKSGGVVSEDITAETGSETHLGQALIHRQKVVSECVLDSYFYICRYLMREEYQAGLKFRKAYLRAVWDIRVDEGHSGAKDTEMAFLIRPIGEQLLREAYSILSPQQKQVIISVCGHDEWAATTARIKTLRRGLAKLAILWRIGRQVLPHKQLLP